MRDKQLKKYENSQKQNKYLKEKNIKEEIETVKQELNLLKIKPEYRDQLNLFENLKNLNKHLSLKF